MLAAAQGGDAGARARTTDAPPAAARAPERRRAPSLRALRLAGMPQLPLASLHALVPRLGALVRLDVSAGVPFTEGLLRKCAKYCPRLRKHTKHIEKKK